MSSIPSDKSKYKTDGFKTGVSRYDQVSSLLWACILVIGLIVGIMAVLYLSMIVRPRAKVVEVMTLDDDWGNEDKPEGIADDFEEPGVEELADVPEPQLADAIEAVTDAPSTVAAALEAVDGNMKQMGTGKGLGDKDERGKGRGNNRNIIPDGERWVIRYTADEFTYSQQLDYFGIELGALAKGLNAVSYANNLSAPTPTKRTGSRGKEPRVYFSYREGTKMRAWDDRLLKKAGIDIARKIRLQFIPGKVRSNLLALERVARNGKSLESVKKTYFGVRAKGAGFEYYVIDIKFRS